MLVAIALFCVKYDLAHHMATFWQLGQDQKISVDFDL
jgi:hypothetical protein